MISMKTCNMWASLSSFLYSHQSVGMQTSARFWWKVCSDAAFGLPCHLAWRAAAFRFSRFPWKWLTTAFGKLPAIKFKFDSSCSDSDGWRYCWKSVKIGKFQIETLLFRRCRRRPDARGRNIRGDVSLPGRVPAAGLLPSALQLPIPSAERHPGRQERQQEGVLCQRPRRPGKWWRKCFASSDVALNLQNTVQTW